MKELLMYPKVSGINFREFAPIHFLLEKGIVATMRNKKYSGYKGLFVYYKGKLVALAEIEKVVENNDENREIYYRISGFKTLSTWIIKAKKLHRGKLPKWIIILRLLKKFDQKIEKSIETFL